MSESTAVIIGASAGVGRALAEKLAVRGYNLVLVARDLRDLTTLCDDLTIRFNISASPLVLDLENPALDPQQFYNNCISSLGHVDMVCIPAGFVSDFDDGIIQGPLIEQTIRTNYLSIIALINCFARVFEQRNQGTIIAFTSIAASAPRRRNMVYASAKAALEFYLKALRHYFAGTKIIVQGYALGYVDTSLSFGKKLFFPKTSPARVADVVVSNLHRDIGIVYYPLFWKYIIGLLKHLPWFIYKRISF